ncbi:GNAT family N-acetyltransferase [Salipaludibacillus aurantiacus]|uniref:Acetyltransferase (GNAT) family protein n=1 Tax=Salipaludibacillus aurantiacus TaxID=1601833 RepID=A0A1H9QAP8_9BACI|nr:GNAT family N-acetyltransferase [Salipaludibacillus aurantiacus]SER57524.1 Acetyltransferase (GNAT) family protein [Salipaludibacillus aurantiacus]
MIIRKLNNAENPPMGLLLTADPSRVLVEEYLEKGDCFVAEKNREVIGVYVLLPLKYDNAEIKNIAVSSKDQGKGIGKKLVKHAIEEARKRGFNTIEIGTGNSSLGQLALYQKCGFRISEIEKDFFTENYSEEIVENGIVCKDMIRLSLKL